MWIDFLAKSVMDDNCITFPNGWLILPSTKWCFLQYCESTVPRNFPSSSTPTNLGSIYFPIQPSHSLINIKSSHLAHSSMIQHGKSKAWWVHFMLNKFTKIETWIKKAWFPFEWLVLIQKYWNFQRITVSANKTRSSAKLTVYSIQYNIIYTLILQNMVK